jgi:S-adenosylmethionine-diacylgycerolhomoserine-N-methlytransferase
MLAKARQKLRSYGPRVSLLQREYNAPVSQGDPFDLIVFSYCLSMINPGYREVLDICREDLSPHGCLAAVDFHDTSFPWFRRWMGVNHVRLEGQLLAAVREAGFLPRSGNITSAYGGLWRWFVYLGEAR